MVKNCCSIICFFSLSVVLYAQDSTPGNQDFVEDGLIRFSATLSPGYSFLRKDYNLYVQLNCDYFFENRIAFRSDLFILTHFDFFNSSFYRNINLLTGASFHFPYYKWDTWITLQPGIAMSKPNEITDIGSMLPYTIEPIFSTGLHAAHYTGKFLHFCTGVIYCYQNYLGNPGEQIPMHELRLVAGIGFQLKPDQMPDWWNKIPEF